MMAPLRLALALPALGDSVGVRNHRRGTSNSPVDAHDGPILQEGSVFYRFGMSYTACESDDGATRTGSFRRLPNRFVETAHLPSTGFDYGRIATSTLLLFPSNSYSQQCLSRASFQ